MTETRTHGAVLTAYGIDPAGLGDADLTIPTVDAAEPQGDVMVIRRDALHAAGTPRVVRGEPVVVVEAETSQRNRHELHADFGSTGVTWIRAGAARPSDLTLGWVSVPEGEGALLIHTGEHGALAMGPGVYEVRRQREYRGEWARVAD